MTRDEIMKLAVEKAVAELTWESIEWLFKPVTMLELFLRLDFEGMKNKIYDWSNDESPTAMPFRHRHEPRRVMQRAIDVEEFYLKLKTLHEAA